MRQAGFASSPQSPTEVYHSRTLQTGVCERTGSRDPTNQGRPARHRQNPPSVASDIRIAKATNAAHITITSPVSEARSQCARGRCGPEICHQEVACSRLLHQFNFYYKLNARVPQKIQLFSVAITFVVIAAVIFAVNLFIFVYSFLWISVLHMMNMEII